MFGEVIKIRRIKCFCSFTSVNKSQECQFGVIDFCLKKKWRTNKNDYGKRYCPVPTTFS